MTTFIRLLETPGDEKPSTLLATIRSVQSGSAPDVVFEQAPAVFAQVPGSPFAYWVADTVQATFRAFPAFEQLRQRKATKGTATTDDARFVRLWYELPELGYWRPFAKGGKWSLYYADVYLVLSWMAEASELKAAIDHKIGEQGQWSRWINAIPYYFRPGLTWPRRTTSGFGIRVMPRGCIFADKGPAAFVDGDSPEVLFALLAVLSSSAFGYLVSIQLAAADAAARSYEVGVIQRTPVPELSGEAEGRLAALARRGWSLKRWLDTVNETSHAFILPPGLNEQRTGLDKDAILGELETLQKQLDDESFRLYGIGPEDRAAIEAMSHKSPATTSEPAEQSSDEGDEGEEDDSGEGLGTDGLRSWLVGVAFARFDLRLATGEREIPPEPDPFDPLPARSPGMLPAGEEPADRPDLLVDDEGHRDDLAARVQAIAERVPVTVMDNLRPWLARDFFPLHIKLYSKSRRKAPIYWQLATPSASYSVWLYIHAFSKDTLFRVQNDTLGGREGKLAHEERKLESLRHELRDGATASQRKALATQEGFVDELRAFLDEVKRVAPLWNPNLDDGVILNFAPLWRLVPQHKAWQKELKETWDALCAGKYDWAHLAMHLWPERVVPKCVQDRSLAIAHGLEEVFWVEGSSGKWLPRKTPTRPVDELVKERTSPAVKSALTSLLDAPVAGGKSSSRRKAANA